MSKLAPHGDTLARLTLRWTIGDVAEPGFEALRLSLHGARQIFGPQPRYVVVVNTVPVSEARRRTGPTSGAVEWLSAPTDPPPPLRPFLDRTMSEGTAWKFAPIQVDRNTAELALDNDVILWDLPPTLARWLRAGASERLIAEDVAPGHGVFGHLAGSEPRNSGIRGTPAGFDLEGAIASILREHPAHLDSELDEQGLQIAAMRCGAEPLVVRTEEVSICSPFPPHQPGLGTCGAHFVGLNAHGFDWHYYDRPALEVRREHWQQHRPELFRRVGIPLAAAPAQEASGAC